MARTKQTARRGHGGKAGAGAVLTKQDVQCKKRHLEVKEGQQNHIGSDQGLSLYGR